MKMTHRSVTVVLGGLLSVALLQTPGIAQGRQGGQANAPANETLSQSYRGSKARDWEFQKVAPIKVFDNLYYVGPGNVSVWLIPTTEGKYREVRRMFESRGRTVKRLVRVQIGKIKLGELRPGKWRTLTEPEIKSLLT